MEVITNQKETKAVIPEIKKPVKKNKAVLISLAILILAGASLFIVLKLKQIGEGPVAPKPKAEEEDVFEGWLTPAPACKITFEAVCQIPSPAPVLTISDPATSRVQLKWNCDQEDADCYAVKKYVYSTGTTGTGSACRVTCVRPPNAVPTIFYINKTEGNELIDFSTSTCNYIDEIPQDLSMCIDYEVEAKDHSLTQCADCASSNGENCCISKSNTVNICGLPAQATIIQRAKNSTGYQVSWADNSIIEKGFKIYRRRTAMTVIREGGGFDDIFSAEAVLVGEKPSSAEEKTGTGQRIWNDISDAAKSSVDYVYEVRPFTDLCGSCGGNLPTPTPTPTGPTATPTSTPRVTTTPSVTTTPKPTSTPPPNNEPYCNYLTASPTSGTATLSVNFSGRGYDKTRIKGYRFTFGDGEKAEFTGSFTEDHIQTTQHSYSKTGTFIAQLEILDDGDHWRTRDECKTTISVSGGGTGPASPSPGGSTPTPVPSVTIVTKTTPTPGVGTPTTAQNTIAEVSPTEVQLPQAGLEIPAIGGLLGGFLLLAIGLVLIF